MGLFFFFVFLCCSYFTTRETKPNHFCQSRKPLSRRRERPFVHDVNDKERRTNVTRRHFRRFVKTPKGGGGGGDDGGQKARLALRTPLLFETHHHHHHHHHRDTKGRRYLCDKMKKRETTGEYHYYPWCFSRWYCLGRRGRATARRTVVVVWDGTPKARPRVVCGRPRRVCVHDK